MNSHEAAEQAARLFMPTAASLARHLPDMGESLAGALAQLARDPTPAGCDEMARRLQAAMHAIGRLRAALVAEHGAG